MKDKQSKEIFDVYINNIILKEMSERSMGSGYGSAHRQYSSDFHENLDKFLFSIIKGKSGFFIDDDLEKYKKLKSYLAPETISKGNDGKTESFEIYLEFMSAYGHKMGEHKKTYVIDDKGVVSLTVTGSGKKTSKPELDFKRDESNKPKETKDYTHELKVGEEREEEVINKGSNKTPYGYAFKFETPNTNIKLTTFVNKKDSNLFVYDHHYIIKYKVKNTNVYRGELSYVIDILNITQELTKQTSSNYQEELTNLIIREFEQHITNQNISARLANMLVRIRNLTINKEMFDTFKSNIDDIVNDRPNENF